MDRSVTGIFEPKKDKVSYFGKIILGFCCLEPSPLLLLSKSYPTTFSKALYFVCRVCPVNPIRHRCGAETRSWGGSWENICNWCGQRGIFFVWWPSAFCVTTLCENYQKVWYEKLNISRITLRSFVSYSCIVYSEISDPLHLFWRFWPKNQRQKLQNALQFFLSPSGSELKE